MSARTVLLVDDHPVLRTGVAAMLARSETYDVVGEAGTVEEAILEARSLRPDVVIADVSLPDGTGIDLARRIKRDELATYVLVLTMHARRPMADNALKAGADGYLLKESTGEHLFSALDAVFANEQFLDPALELAASGGGIPVAPGTDAAGQRFESLSEREYEVFRLLAAGQNSKQIGSLLGISRKTVDNHRASIMTKLELESIADVVRLGIRVGIVEP